MSGLMEKFFGKAPENAATTTANPEALPNNTTTSPAAAATAAAAPIDPLEAMKSLWEVKPTQMQQQSYLGDLKPESFKDIASKVDFGSLMSKDQEAAIAAGGEGAVNAIRSLLNSVGQSAFAVSSMHSAKTTEMGLGNFNSSLDAKLAEMAKKEQAKSALSKSNDVFAHPGIAPVADAVRLQLQAKFPNASADEIAGVTQEMLQGMATQILAQQTQQQQEQQKATQPAEIDWSKVAGLN
jgi:hypothetical protein